jgi:hypothetical protein
MRFSRENNKIEQESGKKSLPLLSKRRRCFRIIAFANHQEAIMIIPCFICETSLTASYRVKIESVNQ